MWPAQGVSPVVMPREPAELMWREPPVPGGGFGLSKAPETESFEQGQCAAWRMLYQVCLTAGEGLQQQSRPRPGEARPGQRLQRERAGDRHLGSGLVRSAVVTGWLWGAPPVLILGD